jgi:molybdenum cofactor cytidylyltransferase
VTGRDSIAAVILAGGASTRMGSPKALLIHGGETFLDRLIALFSERCAPVIAVLGHDAESIGAALARGPEALLVLNPRAERGMFSSLQCGLRAVPSSCEAVFFHPVDAPSVRLSTLEAMIAALRAAPPSTELCLVRHGGRRGHPVLLRPSLAERFLAAPPDSSVRDRIHASLAVACFADVDDEGVLGDVDTPASYAALRGKEP